MHANKLALVCICLTSVTLAATLVEARSCGPIMQGELGIVGPTAMNLSPTWAPSGTQYGIRDLFTSTSPTSECLSCHVRGNVEFPEAFPRFNHCANCHGANAVTMSPPDWLTFDTPEKLARNSYFRPGRTKAEVALDRAKNGTMPPGAWFDDNVGHGTESVSWCKEIQDVFALWIANGYR